jgi:L-aminopeptidase/D-esterase-like protein
MMQRSVVTVSVIGIPLGRLRQPFQSLASCRLARKAFDGLSRKIAFTSVDEAAARPL